MSEPLRDGGPHPGYAVWDRPVVASGRALVLAMLVLLVCDVVGGVIAAVQGIDTLPHAWGFDTESTVPLPMALVQLAFAWVASRNWKTRYPMIAAVVLSVVCLASMLFGLFDGDLRGSVASNGWSSATVLWSFVLFPVNGVVGVLAAARARQLRRLRRLRG